MCVASAFREPARATVVRTQRGGGVLAALQRPTAEIAAARGVANRALGLLTGKSHISEVIGCTDRRARPSPMPSLSSLHSLPPSPVAAAKELCEFSGASVFLR